MCKNLPDIADILEAKKRRWHELAALSWEEKIKIVEQMKQSMPKHAWQTIPAQKRVESTK